MTPLRAAWATTAEAASASDSPPGFWYATDSRFIRVPGSGPFQEPVIGGYYGGCFEPAAVDRADFNGFWGYVRGHSSYAPGVYSAPDVWRRIFGTGAASRIPHTYEWTYEPETANLSYALSGWCYRVVSGYAAESFGGVTRSN